MPFTISHAAAVLPLQRLAKSRLPLAALMIGSMSPDFVYFLPGEPGRWLTHSFVGLFWFCWPVSLATWLLFVHVLEQPSTAMLPETWQVRFPPSDRNVTLRTLALASAAVILGAMTHIIWDSFTHARTPVVDALPGLRAVVVEIGGYKLRWIKLLQHTSTLIGMVALIVWGYRLRAAAPPDGAPRPRAIPNSRRVGAVILLIAGSAAMAFAYFALHPSIPFERRLFHFAIGGMTGFVLAWLAIAITAPSPRA